LRSHRRSTGATRASGLSFHPVVCGRQDAVERNPDPCESTRLQPGEHSGSGQREPIGVEAYRVPALDELFDETGEVGAKGGLAAPQPCGSGRTMGVRSSDQ